MRVRIGVKMRGGMRVRIKIRMRTRIGVRMTVRMRTRRGVRMRVRITMWVIPIIECSPQVLTRLSNVRLKS